MAKLHVECVGTRREIRPAAVHSDARGSDLVPTLVNGKREMMPADPFATATKLRERRGKKSPAARARARMMAAQKKRGI